MKEQKRIYNQFGMKKPGIKGALTRNVENKKFVVGFIGNDAIDR